MVSGFHYISNESWSKIVASTRDNTYTTEMASGLQTCSCCMDFGLLIHCVQPGCCNALCHQKLNSLLCVKNLKIDENCLFLCPPCSLKYNWVLLVSSWLMNPGVPNRQSSSMNVYLRLFILAEAGRFCRFSFSAFYLILLLAQLCLTCWAPIWPPFSSTSLIG